MFSRDRTTTRSAKRKQKCNFRFGNVNVENLQKNEERANKELCYVLCVLLIYPVIGVCSISVYLELYINVVFRNVGKELLNSSLFICCLV